MEQQAIKRVFTLVENISGGSKWNIEDEFRNELTNEIDYGKISFDEDGNVYYEGHFVTTIRNLDDEALWKNRKVYKSGLLKDMLKFYSQMITTLLSSKEIRLPDRELIIMVAIKYMDEMPSNPYISQAIVTPFKNKDDSELEQLPREIRKLLNFYYVPESTRRDAKTTSRQT